MSRREQVLDAAIEVLAAEGPRGLTFQAVDRAAGVPAGTASNSFRNRNALIMGILTHLVDLDRRDWEAVGGMLQPESRAAVVEAMAGVVRHALGPGRSRTAARYALFLQAAAHPELREPITAARATVSSWVAPWLQKIGSPAPMDHCHILLDHLDGLILHRITWPEPDFDPSPGIRALLSGLLSEH
ncbi:TetR/AcrR family transcriptional regulator [Nocardia sp. NBC_01327]|uniref:TetR/AcrR family transcriptional regulator n=1 Tax=Nocardia sp. NBC_01327 TaxID=2903593 RepID=UPI002E12C976|nr:TetR family transcriptional regulator [Nocardia sp. NBC_01327]